MDILEVILRLLYLVVLYGIIFNAFVYFTQLRGNALTVTSFFGAVLSLYATYAPIKNFLSSNEIVLQLKGVEDEENEEGEPSSNAPRRTTTNNRTNIYNEHNVTNGDSSVRNVSRVGHTHEYLQNGSMN